MCTQRHPNNWSEKLYHQYRTVGAGGGRGLDDVWWNVREGISPLAAWLSWMSGEEMITQTLLVDRPPCSGGFSCRLGVGHWAQSPSSSPSRSPPLMMSSCILSPQCEQSLSGFLHKHVRPGVEAWARHIEGGDVGVAKRLVLEIAARYTQFRALAQAFQIPFRYLVSGFDDDDQDGGGGDLVSWGGRVLGGCWDGVLSGLSLSVKWGSSCLTGSYARPSPSLSILSLCGGVVILLVYGGGMGSCRVGPCQSRGVIMPYGPSLVSLPPLSLARAFSLCTEFVYLTSIIIFVCSVHIYGVSEVIITIIIIHHLSYLTPSSYVPNLPQERYFICGNNFPSLEAVALRCFGDEVVTPFREPLTEALRLLVAVMLEGEGAEEGRQGQGQQGEGMGAQGHGDDHHQQGEREEAERLVGWLLRCLDDVNADHVACGLSHAQVQEMVNKDRADARRRDKLGTWHGQVRHNVAGSSSSSSSSSLRDSSGCCVWDCCRL
jgi:hypothetical protein